LETNKNVLLKNVNI